MRPFMFFTVVGVGLAVAPAVAQQAPVRWGVRACTARELHLAGRDADAELLPNGKVRVRIVDESTDAVIAERLVDPPTWRTRAGADCTAMGIADAALTRVGGVVAVKVEISVGDVCERGAPRCAVVAVP